MAPNPLAKARAVPDRLASDEVMTWCEFYLAVECEAALAAHDGRGAVTWYFDSNVAVAVVDEDQLFGGWAYVCAGEGPCPTTST